MHINDLRQRLRDLGALPLHEQRLLRLWTQALPAGSRRRRLDDFLPQALRAAWPGIEAELAGLLRLQSQHPGADGSARLLLALADGQTVESVLLPPAPTRSGGVSARGWGLCISSQVGCAVGCVFCMTGQGGLLRQLGSAEIVAQVVLARANFPQRPIKKVVFMGMGEPAHNLEAVLEAIELLGTGGAIGHKNLVFSTVGDERVFERLAQSRVKPALALSLHTTKPALRQQLLPRAPRFDPADLVAAGEHYARATGYPIQYQWTLIEGVNDGDDEIDGIVQLLHGKYALMNLIPYNTVDGMPWRRPSWERAADMARELHRRGILTKLRHSAGQDVEAGCGQLRARASAGLAQPIAFDLAPGRSAAHRQLQHQIPHGSGGRGR